MNEMNYENPQPTPHENSDAEANAATAQPSRENPANSTTTTPEKTKRDNTTGEVPPDKTETSYGPHQGQTPETGFFDRLRASSWKRNDRNKVAGGVCGNLAEKMGIDPIIVRGITVVLMICTGIATLAYGLAWLVLPEKTSGRTLLEDAKYGQAQPIMTFPILLSVLGFFRIFPEVNLLTGPFSFDILNKIGLPTWFSTLSETDNFSAVGILITFLGAAVITIGATIWVSILFYRRKYSQAWTVCLLVGFGSLLGTIVENILSDILGKFPIFPLFTFTFIGIVTISPISISAFLISAIVGKNKQPSPGWVPSSTATPQSNQTYQNAASPADEALRATNPPSPATGLASPGTSPYANPRAGIYETPASKAPTPGYSQQNFTPSPDAPYASSVFPPDPDAVPLPSNSQRVAGPSPAYSLGIAGLVLLVVFGVNLAQYFQIFPHPEQYWLLGSGSIATILAAGMLILTVRRRRVSWLGWVTPPVVFLIVVPSLLVAEAAPSLRGITKDWNWNSLLRALDDDTQTLHPGDSGQSLGGDLDIDLRGKPRAKPIEAQSVNGNIHIYLHPSQPVRLNLKLMTGEIKLSAMSRWSEKTRSGKKSFLHQAQIETDRPQYFNVEGTQRVLFTDRVLSVDYNANGFGLFKKARLKRPFILENAAVKKNSTPQKINVSCVDCTIDIYERPSEALWNGTVLPDGHFLVNYWLNKNSVVQDVDSDAFPPPVLAKRMVTAKARLAGMPVEAFVPETSARKNLTLTEVQKGALGPWQDANNDGFNDLYQPGGSQWKAGDTLYDPQTGSPLPYNPKQKQEDSDTFQSKTGSGAYSDYGGELKDNEDDEDNDNDED